MKEYQRQMAIALILENFMERDSIEEKTLKLKSLEVQIKNNPIVQQYLSLSEEVSCLEKKYMNLSSDDDLIISGMCEMQNDFRCYHDVWIYIGSSFSYWDLDGVKQYFGTFSNEDSSLDRNEYTYINSHYKCLECGEGIKIKDWERFESSHTVLKDPYDFHSFSDYFRLYKKLLFTNTTEEARKIVIEEFNKNKNKCRKRKK